MKKLSWVLAFVAASAMLFPLVPGYAEERDETKVTVLVAKRELVDRFYGKKVLLVSSAGQHTHLGFILNMPTRTTLGKAYPKHEPSQKIPGFIYLGGLMGRDRIFVAVKSVDDPGGSLRLAKNLFMVYSSNVLDRIIEEGAVGARFFAGIVVWKPGELDSEMKRGFWHMLEEASDVVFRESADSMWEDLVREAEKKEKLI